MRSTYKRLFTVAAATGLLAVSAFGTPVSPNFIAFTAGSTFMPTNLDGYIAFSANPARGMTINTGGFAQLWHWSGNLPSTNGPGTYDVAVGSSGGVYLNADGTVRGWGNIVMPAGLANVVSVAAGTTFALALTADGNVYKGGTGSALPADLTNVAAIAVSSATCLALRRDGSVVGWGANSTGQLNFPPGMSNVTGIALGGAHSFFLFRDGTVKGYGTNSFGLTNSPPGLTNVIAIAAGGSQNLALQSDATAISWGRDATIPFAVSNVAAISANVGQMIYWMRDPVVAGISPDEAVAPGAAVQKYVTMRGNVLLTFQWRLNGTNISGATDSTLTIPSAAPSQAGLYSVLVSNIAGFATSPASALAVGNPLIVSQTGSTNAPQGAPLTLSVNAVSPETPSYQWKFQGQNIAGATQSSLGFSKCEPENAGDYQVTVANSYGSATGDPIHVAVVALPILDQSQSTNWGYAEARGVAVAQTFTPSISGQLDHIALAAYAWNAIPAERPSTFTLLDVSNSKPSTNVLGRVSLPHISTNFVVSFASQNIYLTAGIQYALAINNDAPTNDPEGYYFLSSATDVYPPGSLWQTDASGAWSKIPDQDLLFATYMIEGIPHVRLTTPNVTDHLRLNQAFTIAAQPSPDVAPPFYITFFAEGIPIGSVTNPPYALAWTPSNLGPVDLSASLQDGLGNTYVSTIRRVPVVNPGPANDDFATRTVLTGEYSIYQFSNVNATTEAADPALVPVGSQHTVWWQWTAPRSARATVWIPPPDLTNATLAVYSGHYQDGLFFITNGIGTCDFLATAGTTYQIIVDSIQGSMSNATFAVALNNVEISSPRTNAAFTVPATVSVSGTSASYNRPVAWVDLLCDGQIVATSTNPPYAMTLQTNRPGYYQLSLRVVDAPGVPTFSQAVPIVVRPANDNFGNATAVSGRNVQSHTSNVGATMQTAEPTYASNQGGHSIWYQWTAPSDGLCTINGRGDAGFALLLSIYTGSDVSHLSTVAINAMGSEYQAVGFNAVAGTNYYISVDGYLGEEGPISWSLTLQPPNDNFSGRQRLAGTTVDFITSLTGASFEPGEARVAPANASASMWWSWRAPVSGKVHIHTTAAEPVSIGVFTGVSLTNLVPLGFSQPAWSISNEYSFQSAAAQTYQIGLFGTTGSLASAHISLSSEGLHLISPATDAIFPSPARIKLATSFDVQGQALASVEFFADGQSLGAISNAPFELGCTFTDPKTYVLTASGISSAGNPFTSLPVSMLVYTNRDLPSPQVFAGANANCSYVINAAGSLQFFGTEPASQFGRTTNDDMVSPFLFVSPPNVTRFIKLAYTSQGYHQLPWSYSWRTTNSVAWALSSAGDIYAEGRVKQPFPPGVKSWKSIHGVPPLLLSVSDLGTVYADLTQLVDLGLTNVIVVDAQSGGGGIFTLAADGRAFAHTRGIYGERVTVEIIKPAGVNQWLGISTGFDSCLLQADNGQLYVCGDPLSPVMVSRPAGVNRWVAFSAGALHELAIGDNGELYGWGRNWEQQLGLGASAGTTYASPVLIPRPSGVTAWTAVAGGELHSLALANDCGLYAWGDNGGAQLGQPVSPPFSQPTRVPNITGLCGTPVLFADDASSRLTDGSFKVVFSSDLNRSYLIQYSDDFKTWNNAFPAVTGTGGFVEWVDDGPPKTLSHPSLVATRYYRVVSAQ